MAGAGGTVANIGPVDSGSGDFVSDTERDRGLGFAGRYPSGLGRDIALSPAVTGLSAILMVLSGVGVDEPGTKVTFR